MVPLRLPLEVSNGEYLKSVERGMESQESRVETVEKVPVGIPLVGVREIRLHNYGVFRMGTGPIPTRNCCFGYFSTLSSQES